MSPLQRLCTIITALVCATTVVAFTANVGRTSSSKIFALSTPPSSPFDPLDAKTQQEFTVKESKNNNNVHNNKNGRSAEAHTIAINLPQNRFSTASSSHHAVESRQHHHGTSQGRVLEGGHVLDFSSVKASSRAEEALLDARAKVLQQQQQHQQTAAKTTEILGINAEVLEQVGHELGTFATPAQVQQCAAYMRSQAPKNLFVATSEKSDEFSKQDIAYFTNTIIPQVYKEAGEVTEAFAKTFYMGTMLMPEHARQAIWAVYVWCRRTDEIVDAPRDNNDDMLLDLSSWELRLENLFKYGTVHDVFDLCLLDIRIKYPTLDITPFMDMIRGMLMDVPNLGQDRYTTFDELHLYCYRVAGTVGLMSLPIFGCAEGYNDDIAREPALSLGVAFQLTNILRDVGEDAVQRGRIYLPKEDLDRFGVTEEQIFAQRVDQNYIDMMKFQISRARMYYARARRGVFMLAPESRLPVQSSLDAYGGILDKIEANGYDSLTKRAYVGKLEKMSIIPFSWYRTLDISRDFPLPGDLPVKMDQV